MATMASATRPITEGGPRDGEYFGQFWGAGVPRFGVGMRQDLQAAIGERGEEPRTGRGEWCATWAWTKQPAANKKLRPAPRASKPLLHIDEAIRRLKEKDASSVKVKALNARRRMLTMKPFKPEHGPRGFGSSIKTDRGVDPRSYAKADVTSGRKRKPLRSEAKSVQRPGFSAPHSYRRREVKDTVAIKKKLDRLQQLKDKVAQGEELTPEEQQQAKPITPGRLKVWQNPTAGRDDKAFILNRIDELERELAEKRRERILVAAINKKLDRLQQLKVKVTQGEELTPEEQQQAKPVAAHMLKVWQDPTAGRDDKVFIENRIDELERELAGRTRKHLEIAPIKKKLGRLRQLKDKVTHGKKLTPEEQLQAKPTGPDMLEAWLNPTAGRDDEAFILNRIDELERELVGLESRKHGFGTSQQTYRGTQSPLCPWSSVDPGTLDIRADAHKVRAPTKMDPPSCANVPIGAKTALVFDKEGHLVSSLAGKAEEMGQDMMTTKPFYQFSQGMTEEERAAAAQDTIRRRALNNVTVLKRKLRAASYTIDGNDWDQLFMQSDSDGNGTLDSDEFRAMVRRCGITQITNIELDVLYNAIDVDGSGDITVEEFMSFLTDKTTLTKTNASGQQKIPELAADMTIVEPTGSAAVTTLTVPPVIREEQVPPMPQELRSVMEQLRAAIRANRTLYGQAVRDARSAFAAIDTDADGMISISEFRAALERLDLAKLLPPHKMETFFSLMDRSGTGMIEWEEFLLFSGLDDEGPSAAEQAVRQAQARLRVQQETIGGARIPLKRLDRASQHAIFDRMDANGNGVLSLAEIDKAVIELYPEFNHKPALMRAYKAADLDKDGWIERREFGNFLQSLVYFNNLWHLFEAVDNDGDRRLDSTEFIAGCRHVGVEISSAEAMAEFATMAGTNGHVLFIDFCKWCVRRHIAGDQAEKENERPKNRHAHFGDAVNVRTISPAEPGDFAVENTDDASAAAVGVVTPAQQELLDYIEDLYELAALNLITDEELEERKNAVIDELETHLLDGESSTRVDGAPPSNTAKDRTHYRQSDDCASELIRGTEVRAPGPNHTKLYTQRIVARLNLPDQDTCDRLFTRFDHHRVDTLSLPAMQSLVADLWQGDQSPPVPRVIERAFRGAELDESKRLPRRECRDVLKCIIYLDAMPDTLASISSIDKLTMTSFVDACAVVKEPITAPDAQAEFRQLRDQDNMVSLDRFCMWLACRNVLDSTGTPSLAGPVVVPAGADVYREHASSTAHALVAAHEIAEKYASSALQNRPRIAKPQQEAQLPVAQEETSVEFIAPAEVQTDIPELVLGGESCPKVPVRPLQSPKPTGTAFDLHKDHQAVSWRTNREIEREVAHRQSMDRLAQASIASGTHAPHSANALVQQNEASPGKLIQQNVPTKDVVAPTEPVVIDVEPVVLGNTTYLVDKVNGLVYNNVMEPGQEPVVVGRWNSKILSNGLHDEASPTRSDPKNTKSAAQRWANSVAIPRSSPDSNSETQSASVDDTSELQSNSGGGDSSISNSSNGKVQFSSHAHIDVGSIPTVRVEPRSAHSVPLWSAGVSDDIVLPVAAPQASRLKAGAEGEKLQFLASHGLEDWPGPRDDEPSAPRPTDSFGRYHQKNARTPTAARSPSPRSPRWDLPSDEKVVGRDLAPSSPRGLRRSIEDGIRVLRSMNGTKHTGNSHTPGVSQTRTLPPRERNWAGLTDDPLIKAQRDSTNQQRLKENPLPKLDPEEETAFNNALAMERRVLASDQQSWAYLSLQQMAKERDLVATNPEHFIDRVQQQRGGLVNGERKEPSPSMANYRLGSRGVQSKKEEDHLESSRNQRVSINEENNRYSDGSQKMV